MKSLNAMLREIKDSPPEDDLIQDLLPDSRSAYLLIAGRSGIGKTFLALNILYCLASGTKFLNHNCKQCRVGYFSMEGSRTKIGERFTKMADNFDHQATDHIFWEHSLPLTLNPKGMLELEQILTGLKVAIIDPLRPLVAGDYTSPKDATNFLKNLATVQNETGCRLILIHHVRKPDRRYKVHPEDLQFEVKGASEYVEAANTCLLLEIAPQERGEYGKFGQASSNKMLYFTKVKDAPTDLLPVKLQFNKDTLLFQPLTNQYDDEAEGQGERFI